MTDIKKFSCGLCKKNKIYIGTRKGLRKHLQEEHRIMTKITNDKDVEGKSHKRRWWINELFI